MEKLLSEKGIVMDAIKIEQLSKSYGKKRGIRNVDLVVKEGDFFGFVGPNGAGKSTTIRLLVGLIGPDSGKAEIFEKSIHEKKDEILNEIGFMGAEAFFYPEMKVKDVIRFSAELRGKDCRENAKSLCERLKLDVNKKIRELSLGNRKKVAIVCAFQHDPKLCILDEPTSGLDPLMQREFYHICKEANQKGTTIFLSSHNLSEVQRTCQRIAFIREGEIILEDAVENLNTSYIKEVTIKGSEALPDLKDVRNVQIKENQISFLYNGEIKELLKSLSDHSLSDITIHDPDLEEIFMHYYKEGD